MAIKLIGRVEYEINDPPIQGGGSFFLTEELLGKIQMLQLESEETIDRLVHTELPYFAGYSSIQTAKQHSCNEESTDERCQKNKPFDL